MNPLLNTYIKLSVSDLLRTDCITTIIYHEQVMKCSVRLSHACNMYVVYKENKNKKTLAVITSSSSIVLSAAKFPAHFRSLSCCNTGKLSGRELRRTAIYFNIEYLNSKLTGHETKYELWMASLIRVAVLPFELVSGYIRLIRGECSKHQERLSAG